MKSTMTGQMTPEELQKQRIEQAYNNYEAAEALVDRMEKNNMQETVSYFEAMCNSIYYEQIYDQIIHYYQAKIQVSKETAKMELDRRMRKKWFLILQKSNEKDYLLIKLKESQTRIERIEIKRQIISLTISIGEMTRQANAFELRSFESINNIEK